MKVFLSYSNEHNSPLIKQLNSELTLRGYQVWVHMDSKYHACDELSITLGMQQKEVLKVLLKGEELAVDLNNSIDYMDMCEWNRSYDQEILSSIIDAINYQESQSFIGEGVETCPQGSKQWHLKVTTELWDEFVKVGGVVEQLSRYALYDLPNMLMTLSQQERSSIVGGVKGWEEIYELVNQVDASINSGNQLVKLWSGLSMQMNEDYGLKQG